MEMDFGEALEKHKRLFLMWTMTLITLLAAREMVFVSIIVAMMFFVVGAVLLSATGISCAYAIVRESQ